MADNVEAIEEHLIVVQEPEVLVSSNTTIQDDHINVKSIPPLVTACQTSSEADQIRAEEDRILLDEGKRYFFEWKNGYFFSNSKKDVCWVRIELTYRVATNEWTLLHTNLTCFSSF